MQVILLKDIPKVGRRYDTKEVSDGHAINFLIPKGMAIAATPSAILRITHEKAKVEGERKIQDELLVKNIKGLEKVTLTITGKANEKGHLFAGLHREDIVAELTKQTQLRIDPSFIQLDQPVKEVGEYTIEVNGGGKSATFKVVVKAA